MNTKKLEKYFDKFDDCKLTKTIWLFVYPNFKIIYKRNSDRLNPNQIHTEIYLKYNNTNKVCLFEFTNHFVDRFNERFKMFKNFNYVTIWHFLSEFIFNYKYDYNVDRQKMIIDFSNHYNLFFVCTCTHKNKVTYKFKTCYKRKK